MNAPASFSPSGTAHTSSGSSCHDESAGASIPSHISSNTEHITLDTRTRQICDTLVEAGRPVMARRYLDFAAQLSVARADHWRLRELLERYEAQARGEGETLRQVMDRLAVEGP